MRYAKQTETDGGKSKLLEEEKKAKVAEDERQKKQFELEQLAEETRHIIPSEDNPNPIKGFFNNTVNFDDFKKKS